MFHLKICCCTQCWRVLSSRGWGQGGGAGVEVGGEWGAGLLRALVRDTNSCQSASTQSCWPKRALRTYYLVLM